MVGESQLNVYIVGADKLSPRVRERTQAQVQSGLRAIPQWVFTLLRLRLLKLGLPNLPIIVEPQQGDDAPAEGGSASGGRALSVGSLRDKPAVYLSPLVRGESVQWRRERKQLLAQGLAYLCAPSRREEEGFWQRWQEAIDRDGLSELASAADRRWQEATPLDLLMEMFAAYVLSPEHRRWQELPAVRRFLDGWRATVAE